MNKSLSGAGCALILTSTRTRTSSIFIIIIISFFLAMAGCGGGGGGGGDGGGSEPTSLTVSGLVLAPGGQIAANQKKGLINSVASIFIQKVEAAVTGLLPVPDGTLVDLVLINDAGTVDTVLDSVGTVNSRYSFNLTALDVVITNNLMVMVGDMGVQMRAFVTDTTIDIHPISEATVQLVIEQIAAVAGALLENFTLKELEDIYASIDLLTTLDGLVTQPGVDPTVQSIKDLVSQDNGIVSFLQAASTAGQTGVGPGDIGNLFPLDQGNVWEYLVTSSETSNQYYEAYSVIGTKDINGVTASILHYGNPDNSGVPYDEYLENNSTGQFYWESTDPEDFF